MTALLAWGGPGKTLVIFGAATIVWGIINWFCFPVDPTKVGFLPDNGDSTEEERAALRARMSGPRVWTMKEVLKDRNFWLVMIGYGLLFMVSSGFLQQMVPYQISMRVRAFPSSSQAAFPPIRLPAWLPALPESG